MARARNIKPGLYKNEELAECSIWARLIFPGLWMLADREGRLEDRPKRIKGELLAFDSQDVDPLLNELQAHGFLVRYQNEDGSFIQISKFSAHQKPHYSEKESVIKPPILQESRRHDEPVIPENSGELRKEGVIKRGSQPPDSLIPDSLIPDTGKEPVPSSAADAADPSLPECPQQQVVALYHQTLPSLVRVREWTPQRQKLLRSRWRESSERQSMTWWREFFEYVASSDFLMGRVNGRGGVPFECSLEWLIRPTNLVKVIEGNYENKGHAA